MKKIKILFALVLTFSLISIFGMKSEAKIIVHSGLTTDAFKNNYEITSFSKKPFKVKFLNTKPTRKSTGVYINANNYGDGAGLYLYDIKKNKSTYKGSLEQTFYFKKNGTYIVQIRDNETDEWLGDVTINIYNIDKTPPEISIGSPRYHEISDGYMVRFSAFDDDTGVKYIYYPSGRREYLGKKMLGASPRFDATPGTYTIKAVDNVGNVAVNTFKVSKEDYKNRRKLKKF
ncbi:hypothetical protein ACIQ4I_12245 [Rummeliibacillus sp. NPDC094406]|uniref:hypothetical protein n=1 Tax=Rummeliibacillus sp. NPDC094406 TaxID=3364511 RepID=UPI00382BFA01